MRRIHAFSVVLLLAIAALASESTLQEMIAHAEAARLQDQPDLYVEIADKQLRSADELYKDGKVDEAAAAVKNVVTYSQKAHDTAIQSGRRLKNTEIALRKMSSRLRDIKRTLNFEDQPPVAAAAERLQNLSAGLLAHMFGNKK